jgi:uncharacterized protein (TIGR02099 family)
MKLDPFSAPPAPQPHHATPKAVAAASGERSKGGKASKAMGRALNVVMWLLALTMLLLALLWVSVQWLILPNLDRWRGPIEARVSQAVGQPVKVGAIKVLAKGLRPVLEVDGVSIQGAAGEALRVGRVTAHLAAKSLWTFQPQFEQLVIDDAVVDARRDPQGRLWVAGFEVGKLKPESTPSEPGDAGRWLLQQREVAIRRAAVRWTDERRQSPMLTLESVEAVLRNQLGPQRDQLELRLDATPPAAFGDRFSLMAQMQQGPVAARRETPLGARSKPWQRWQGTVYVDVPRADAREWRQHVNLPFELNAGRGSLKLWLEVAQGQPSGLVADVDLADVDLRLAQDLEPLNIGSMQTRMRARRDNPDTAKESTTLALEGWTFRTRDGRVWPRGDVKVRLDGPPNAPLGGELTAQALDLSVLALVARRLPLAAPTRELLTQLDPRGLADKFLIDWQGPLEQPTAWRMNGRVQGLWLNPAQVAVTERVEDQRLGRPGVKGADVDFEATHEGGRAQLAMARGTITLPGVLELPEVALDRLDTALTWTLSRPRGAGLPPDVVVSTQRLGFANVHMQGEARGQWRTGPGEGFGANRRYPGLLDLHVKLDRGDAKAIARYLPLELPKDVRTYVATAFENGELSQATARVRGDLKRFPYPQGDGEFKLSGKVSKLRMNIAPALFAQAAEGMTGARQPRWPLFEDVQGQVSFDRLSMTIDEATARMGDLRLQGVTGRIADFKSDPTLSVSGTADGPVAAMVGFVNASPVGRWIGGSLAQTSATGDATLKVQLRAPLRDLESSTVEGQLNLTGNDVQIRPDVPLLKQARGQVTFTDKGMKVSQAEATVLGGPARFVGGTQSDGSLRFDGAGQITAEAFRAAQREFGEVTRLGRLMQGQAAYDLVLRFDGPQASFDVSSSMQGMRVDAPAPLGKAADEVVPLRVWTTLTQPPSRGAKPQAGLQDVLNVQVGTATSSSPRQFAASYLRALSEGPPRVVAGQLHLGSRMGAQTSAAREPLEALTALAAQPADARVVATASVPVFESDAWLDVLERLDFGGKANLPSRQQADPSRTSLDANDDIGRGYIPQRVTFSTEQFRAEGRSFKLVKADVRHERGADVWSAQVEGPAVQGTVRWHAPASDRAALVQARLARLHVPDLDAPASPEEASQAAQLAASREAMPPSMDLVVDALVHRDKALGRLDLHGAQEREGSTSVWRLSRLSLANEDAELTASGRWHPAEGTKLASMAADFQLQLHDSGDFLNRLGVKDAVRGGEGLLSGQVSWQGTPTGFNLPTLDGRVVMKIESGQILKVDAGAARLLGVLTLQSLPRRLLLDFRDVFYEGFAFDSVEGEGTLTRGQLSTQNLHLRGVQAKVSLVGTADLQRETQDMQMWVVPDINAGAASLAYAAVNPAVGLGTFIAQWVFRRPLMDAITRQYHVSGSWAQPQIVRVERKPGVLGTSTASDGAGNTTSR